MAELPASWKIVTFFGADAPENSRAIARAIMPGMGKGGKAPGYHPVVVHAPTEAEAHAKFATWLSDELDKVDAKRELARKKTEKAKKAIVENIAAGLHEVEEIAQAAAEPEETPPEDDGELL